MATYGDDGFTARRNDPLFTFPRYPGLPSTNIAERDIRDTVAVQRRFRHKFASRTGMRVFSIPYGSIGTCDKMRAVPMRIFEMVVAMSGFDTIPYGLIVLNPRAPSARRGMGQWLGLNQDVQTAEPECRRYAESPRGQTGR